jgi:hypothetical protein
MTSCEGNNNCDFRARLEDKKKPGKEVYGKKMLTSHRLYDLWNEETVEFNMNEINKLYMLFVANMYAAAQVFHTKWVRPEELLTASKGLIWEWSSEEERDITAEGIAKYGLYFPIFTLDKGKLHNQIMSPEAQAELSSKGLYNSYNGNHRIDAIHCLVKQGVWQKNVLIYIIPEYCQKSCTGFKYDPIDDNIESQLTQWKLPRSLRMFHLDRVEHEMKVTNWRYRSEIDEGISIVKVDNYNVVYRIINEIQNALEPVLTRYYELNGCLPECITRYSVVFNDEEEWKTWMEEDKTL